jgi:hypothetical protein
MTSLRSRRRSVGHGAPGDERLEEPSRQLDSVQLCAADPARVRSIVVGLQDAGHYLAEVVVDHVYQSRWSVAIDTSHVSDDPDKKSGLLQDLAHAGVFGRFVRTAAPARNGPEAERRLLAPANQEQPALVVEDDSTGTRLPIRLHSDILVSARRPRDGVLMRYEKPTTCAQIGIGVGVTLSRFLWIALIIFLVFFIVTAPQTAAAIANNLWNAILFVFNGLSNFVKSL